MKFLKAIMLVIVICNFAFSKGLISWFLSMKDTTTDLSGYPTALQAFRDYVGSGDYVFSKELFKASGFNPDSFNNSYRIPCRFRLNEAFDGIDALIVQMVVKYKSDEDPEGEFRSLSIPGFLYYDERLKKWVLKDRIFIYYFKTLDGWLYFGAETFLTGNYFERLFMPFLSFGEKSGSGK